MVGSDFYFNGHWLSDFYMGMYDPEEAQQFAPRELERAEVTHSRPVPNHYSARYGDTLVLSLFILKDPDVYDRMSARRITADELNDIRSWLESTRLPTELRMLDMDDGLDTYYYGVFTETQPFVVNQECYGIYLTFSCNAPYGFTPYVSQTYHLAGGGEAQPALRASYYNYSCERRDYIMPVVELSADGGFDGSEGVTIKNVSDGGNAMKVRPVGGLSRIIIDCQGKRVTDGEGNPIAVGDVGLALPLVDKYSYLSADAFLFYWLRLVPGNNELEISTEGGSAAVDVEIRARYPRKAGGFG